jgi:hypothetical protein
VLSKLNNIFEESDHFCSTGKCASKNTPAASPLPYPSAKLSKALHRLSIDNIPAALIVAVFIALRVRLTPPAILSPLHPSLSLAYMQI